MAPVPYWAFAAGYLAAGVLMFLRPVQRLLLSWLYGARRPTPDELDRLEPAWHDVLRQAGLPARRFVLAVTDSPELNAYACGGHVVAVSTAALELLPDDELRGVLAHELGHHLGLHTVALDDHRTGCRCRSSPWPGSASSSSGWRSGRPTSWPGARPASR